jgi:HPt (histidine-containing phosphotransfer) domain-containing protein
MNDFLTKPIDPNRMLETIEKWLTKAPGVTGSTLNQEQTIEPVGSISMEEGISRLGGNRKLYSDLLKIFSDNHQRFVSQLKEKIEAGESDETRRMVHTLKGLSASLGMTGLHQRCKDLEGSLAKDKSPSLNGSLQPLSDELNKVLTSIKTFSH